MLDIAICHQEEIKQKMRRIWFEDKYKFFNYTPHYSDYTSSEDTWEQHEFVSMDESGEVIGLISYKVERQANYCYGLAITNFSENKFAFGVDLEKALKDIFTKFNFNKLKFSVVIGNPIEKAYDKAIKRYGGKITGIEKQETRLMDGKLYDVKRYEIMRSDYIEAIHTIKGDKKKNEQK